MASPSRPRPEPLYTLFTTIPQDWFAVVVRGEDFHRVIHGIKGWYVDENGEFQREDPNNLDKQNLISPIRAMLGREFVGIPPIQGILVYKFAWNKFWRKEEGGNATPEYTVQAHDREEVYLTPFESQYPLIYSGIDVISTDRPDNQEEVLISIGVTVTVRVRIRNPRVALCTNTDWFGQVLTPNIQRAVKEFAGDKTYDWMIREAKSRGSKDFSEQFMSSSTDPDSFYNRILRDAGVEVVDIGITDIAPNKAYQDALDKQAEAERAAKATVVTAEGKKKARILEGQGDSEYEKLVGEGKKAAFEAVASSIGRQNVPDYIKWEGLKGSKLTYYAESGVGNAAGIVIGLDGKPSS